MLELRKKLANYLNHSFARGAAGLLCALIMMISSGQVFAVPTPGSSCTASAINRNGAVDANYNYTLFNVPANQGILKVRVTCSDGTVGQTRYEQPVANSTTFTGDILWGKDEMGTELN